MSLTCFKSYKQLVVSIEEDIHMYNTELMKKLHPLLGDKVHPVIWYVTQLFGNSAPTPLRGFLPC